MASEAEIALRGAILKEGELQVERTAGTFRSPWVARRVILTEVGLFVYETANARKKEARGPLVVMIPIETLNGVLLEPAKKKRHFLVLASFFKDHRFLCESEETAAEWRRLLAGAMVARRKQAAVKGKADSGGSMGRAGGAARLELARDLRDVEAARNEELNALLQSYLERRTACVDELLRRELWAVREQANAIRSAIAAVLAARSAGGT